MSNLSLSIGGRNFTVACAPGEEEHVAGLGRMIDAKLAAMGDLAGQSESRMLLFAALLLADEIHELKFRDAPQPGPSTAPSGLPEAMGERLVALAGRLENLAARLEEQ